MIVINSYAAGGGGGGGSGTWYDALSFGSAINSIKIYPGQLAWNPLKSLPAGTVTKMRCKLTNLSSSTQVHLGLYDSSGNLLGSTNYESVTADGVYEWDMISPVVISAGDHTFAIQGWDNNAVEVSGLFDAPEGDGFLKNPSTWRAFNDPLPAPSFSGNPLHAIGVFIV